MPHSYRLLECLRCKMKQVFAVSNDVTWRCRNCDYAQVVGKIIFRGSWEQCYEVLVPLMQFRPIPESKTIPEENSAGTTAKESQNLLDPNKAQDLGRGREKNEEEAAKVLDDAEMNSEEEQNMDCMWMDFMETMNEEQENMMKD